MKLRLNWKIKSKSQVLNLLRTHSRISRVEIANLLGLTRSAVTMIIKDLIAQGVVGEIQNQPLDFFNKRGQNRIYLEICPNFKFVFGVSIQKNIISIGLSNLIGKILSKRYFELEDSKNITNLLKTIIAGCGAILDEDCLDSNNVLAIGICFDNSFFSEDIDENELYCEMSNVLRKKLNIFVCFDKLINGLTIAQAYFYHVHDIFCAPGKFMYIHLCDEILSSLAIKIHPWEEYVLSELNFGKMRCVFKNKSILNLSQADSINDLSSINGIKKNIDKICCNSKDKNICELSQKTNLPLCDAVLFDPSINLGSDFLSVIQDACQWLGVGIYNSINLLNAEKVVFSGKVFENPNISENFRNELKKILPKNFIPKVDISQIKTKNIFLSGCAIAVRDGLSQFLDMIS